MLLAVADKEAESTRLMTRRDASRTGVPADRGAGGVAGAAAKVAVALVSVNHVVRRQEANPMPWNSSLTMATRSDQPGDSTADRCPGRRSRLPRLDRSDSGVPSQ